MRESIRRGLKYTFATIILIGPVAQRLEQGTHNPLVLGSNPRGPTINASLAQSVEQLTFNQLVLSSSLRGCTI